MFSDVRIAIVGGGPGGLFAAALFRSADPAAQVTVFERNRPQDTFGFGVVFSDATLNHIDAVDPLLLRALRDHGVHWDPIEVRVHGERWRCGGNGMAAIARARLLTLLHDAARGAGVDLHFQTEVDDIGALAGDYDLVVGADGANSAVRRWMGDDEVGLTVEVASAKFIWLATTKRFDGLTFLHHRGPDGVFAVHGYPFSDEASTFIVETDEESWRRAGLDTFDVTQPPGPSDMQSKAYLEGLFAEHLDGHPLLVNNSRWANFRTIRCRRWSKGNAVIIGDAAHTAHFSVGSGTKMAMEDAAALVTAITENRDPAAALSAYEDVRRPAVARIQGAARPSLSWWEHFGRYHDHLGAPQFAFHFFSRAIPRRKLAQRDPAFVADVESWWQAEHGAAPLETPLETGDLKLADRIVTLGADQAVPLVPPGADPPPGTWGLTLEAPGDEAGIPAAVQEIERGIGGGAALVAVRGGTPVTRVLLCEEARLVRKAPALLIDDGLTADDAATLILSGRADLVGAPAAVADTWRTPR
jgi:salicyloyl-CoA 5-hydroxylase